MKKILLAGFVIVVFVLYSIYHNNSATIAPTTNKNNGTSTISDSSVKGTQTKSAGAFKDGSYTGSAADAFYGTIQVKAIIQNGKISDVQFLQYPNDQSESIQVNQAAMPQLKQEAIQAQNANVDVVSGATQSSNAFKQSLANALSQAKS